ncbi:putative leucine-rich repeat-containing protein DDB_G0290503 [Chironomus tepperi]|uniref:putative leucine-rich repeat-containing protein DDB_G0290503 n=1 Tax=Chironomus tepperi TaxID=113505 RepID=UPI00391F45B0
MMKFKLIILLLFISFNDQSASNEITCKFEYFEFDVIGDKYHCDVNEDPQITDELSADITSIYGSHADSHSNYDVAGLYIYQKTIHQFPRGLEKHFINIEFIDIRHCGLKEVHQSDLKPFPELIYLALRGNEIQVIEADLFEFNPKLKNIEIGESHVLHIDLNVFDDLPALIDLNLVDVPCFDGYYYARSDLQTIIQKVKEKCENSDYLTMAEELAELEADLDADDFVEKLRKIENSKFSKFRSFRDKIKSLKAEYYLYYPQVTVSQVQGTTDSPDRVEDPKSVLDSVMDSNAPQYSAIDPISPQYRALDPNAQQYSALDPISPQYSALDSISPQCHLNPILSDIKSSLTYLNNSQNDQKSTLTQFTSSISTQCTKSDNQSTSAITELTTTVNDIIVIQNTTTNSIKVIHEDIKTSQNILKTSQDVIMLTQSSMSDMEVILSDLKKSQTDVKDVLIKIKNSQNEMRISLNSMGRNDDNVERFEKLEVKLATIEGHLTDFKAESAEKFDKIAMELLNTRHKMAVNLDEKIKGIEKRIVKRFEDILDEKLGKIEKN